MIITVTAISIAVLIVIGMVYARGYSQGKQKQESLNLERGVKNALEASKNRVERDSGSFDDVKHRLREFSRSE